MTTLPDDWHALLGRKVSIRYALHGDPDYPFSEAIGVIMAVGNVEGAERVKIIDRRGETTDIRSGDILAAKVFPST